MKDKHTILKNPENSLRLFFFFSFLESEADKDITRQMGQKNRSYLWLDLGKVIISQDFENTRVHWYKRSH